MADKKRTGWTPKKKDKFIEHLRHTGNVAASARMVGLGRSRAFELRKEDPAFGQAWEEAIDDFVDRCEEELRRRAVEGYKEDVFYGGKKVGEITKYSDVLLMFYLKSLRPGKYREHSRALPEGARIIITYAAPEAIEGQQGEDGKQRLALPAPGKVETITE